MNLEYFIAKRLATAKSHKSSVSSPIIKIATIAVALGIIMMLVAVATSMGLQQKIREKFSAVNGHIIISNFDDNQSEINTIPIATEQDFYPNFTTVSGIKHIQAIANKTALIRTEETVEGVVFKGVGADYDWSYLQNYLVQGTLPNVSSKITDDIVISEYLANRLKLKLNDVARTYFLKDGGKGYNLRSFKIVGIFNSGFQDFDANYVLGDIRHIQKINKWKPNEIGQFEVFIDDFDKIEEKGEEVYKAIPPIYNSTTIAQKYYGIFEWLKMFDFNTLIILIVMIVVATINMIVALLVLILERTQMIGILKALGASNWVVRKVFLYNAFRLISNGLLWGNGIAIALLLIQKYFQVVKLNPENYYVTSAPVVIDIPYFLLINMGTILICLVVLMLPSYIITKISPVKAIRFD
ncbi:ABC transporter permease [Flavobacterium sp.]|uniref:ABC transporter permease n=1 Tax=Flavobacterium sp. TaxID=239 RepID=UPI003526F7B0